MALVFGSATAGATPAGVVHVSVAASQLGYQIGRGFVGLSFEASALPTLARDATRGDLTGLLRSVGPGIVRFGGDTADASVAFSANGGPAPRWAGTRITPADLASLTTLLRRTMSRVILTLSLAHYDPSTAAAEAAAASGRLRGRLASLEIGNEPNAYPLVGLRPQTWNYREYLTQFGAYLRAVSFAAPGVPVVGPDTVGSRQLPWLTAFARDERPALLTAHYYPLNVCFRPPGTLEELLGPALSRAQGRALHAFASIGRTSGVPVRVDETNNVGCAGRTGVSNTYGAALWAVRYMLSAARAGIAGLNFHTLIDICSGYSPICAPTATDAGAGRFVARPEWYALLLVHQLVGDWLVRDSIAGNHPGLTVDTLANPTLRRLDVVIVNTGAASLSVRLRVPGPVRPGKILRLIGPGLTAESGVSLGGRSVSSNGTWRPARSLPAPVEFRGGVRVKIPSASAALVRLRMAS